MTATDPRPGLAAMLAERLAPAAEALAGACAEDISAAPPPEDDRALAGHYRAGRAALSHLRQLLGLLDRAAARLPEPEQAPAGEPANDPDAWTPEPEPGSGYDGSEDEYHYFDEVYVGSQKTPEFRDWLARQERREAADIAAREAAAGSAGAGGWRRVVGHAPAMLTAAPFPPRARWKAAAVLLPSRSAGGVGGGPLSATGRCRVARPLAPTRPPPQAGEEIKERRGSCPKRLQHMNPAHAEHDIS